MKLRKQFHLWQHHEIKSSGLNLSEVKKLVHWKLEKKHHWKILNTWINENTSCSRIQRQYFSMAVLPPNDLQSQWNRYPNPGAFFSQKLLSRSYNSHGNTRGPEKPKQSEKEQIWKTCTSWFQNSLWARLIKTVWYSQKERGERRGHSIKEVNYMVTEGN